MPPGPICALTISGDVVVLRADLWVIMPSRCSYPLTFFPGPRQAWSEPGKSGGAGMPHCPLQLAWPGGCCPRHSWCRGVLPAALAAGGWQQAEHRASAVQQLNRTLVCQPWPEMARMAAACSSGSSNRAPGRAAHQAGRRTGHSRPAGSAHWTGELPGQAERRRGVSITSGSMLPGLLLAISIANDARRDAAALLVKVG
jgi:hypothetical protein